LSREALEYYNLVLNILLMTLFVTSIIVLSCDCDVIKITVSDKIVTETLKKHKIRIKEMFKVNPV